MKGQAVIYPVVAVFLLTLVSGTALFVTSKTLPDRIQNSIDDVNTVARAETSNDMIVNDYYPMAMEYSVDQMTYELNSKVYRLTGRNGVKEDIISRVEGNASDYLRDNYVDGAGLECEQQLSEATVSLSDNGENATAVGESTEPLVETKCKEGGTKVRYVSEREDTSGEVNGNRIFLLAGKMESAATQMYSAAASVTDSGSGSVSTSCGYETSTAAENAADSDASSTATSKLDSIESTVNNSIFNSTTYLEVSKSIDDSRSTRSSSTSNVGSSSCCDSYGTDDDGNRICTDSDYEGSADYSYDYSKLAIEVTIKDTKYRLPVASGWKYVEWSSFFVKDFS